MFVDCLLFSFIIGELNYWFSIQENRHVSGTLQNNNLKKI